MTAPWLMIETEEARAWEWLCKTYLQEPADPTDLRQRSRIRKSMLEQAESYVYASRQSGPPTDLNPLLRKRGVARLLETNLGFRDGLLLTGPDGLEIRVNSERSPSRRRAAMAHEFGHTFFFDFSESPPKRRVAFPRARYWVEEGIARELGRAILIPRQWLKADGIPTGESVTISALRRLSSRYDVSLEILLYRLFRDLKAVDAVVTFAEIETVEPFALRFPATGRFKGKSYSGFRIPERIGPEDKFSQMALQIHESDSRSVETIYKQPWKNPGDYRLEIARHATEGVGRYVALLAKMTPKLKVQSLEPGTPNEA